jgi:hypothetical protein
MQTYELDPVNGRKSFYGKCSVIDNGEIAELRSYNTIVAKYCHKMGKMEVFGWYSSTTATHINAFLAKFGFPTATKKEMEDWKN